MAIVEFQNEAAVLKLMDLLGEKKGDRSFIARADAKR